MRIINIVFVVLFITLGIFTGLNREKINKELPTGDKENAQVQETKTDEIQYRGYKINLSGRFGERDERTGAQYLIATENEARIMYETLTHDWEQFTDDDGVEKRKKSEWNVGARFYVVPEGSKPADLYPHNSLLSFYWLDANKKGFKCPFNPNQAIRFYTTKEVYQNAIDNQNGIVDGEKIIEKVKHGR